MNLSNFIYDFNLSTTGTVKDIYDKTFIINDGRKRKIDFDDSISLYDLVKIFNDAYLPFSMEVEDFKKYLKVFGEGITYLHHCVSDSFATLVLAVDIPTVDLHFSEGAIVTLVNRDDEYYAVVDNGRRLFDKDYISIKLDIDSEYIKRCLDVIKENDLFLKAFVELHNQFIFGDGTTVLFSNITGNPLDGISIFTLSFGNHYMNTYDFVEIKISLGDDLEILYDESKVIYDGNLITNSSEKEKIINELLERIYINKDRLGELYKPNEYKKLLEKRNDV